MRSVSIASFEQWDIKNTTKLLIKQTRRSMRMLFQLQYSHSTQSWAMFYVLQGSGTMDIFDIL
jgi:hypothetical protein